MKVKNFTDLNAWQEAHKLTLNIYKLTKRFPSEERFSLTSQIQRSAISVPSNIAEGFGRGSRKEKQKFYVVARGSLYELQSQMILAKDLEYIGLEQYTEFEEQSIAVSKLLSGLINAAANRIDNDK